MIPEWQIWVHAGGAILGIWMVIMAAIIREKEAGC